MKKKIYAAIDLKSFYSSVECVERGLDPLTTNLVVADKSRTEKTICLAVTPALKSYGIPGRARLFEVVQRVKEVNWQRQRNAPGRIFSGSFPYAGELEKHPELALDYIVAPPRMALYMEYSTRVYSVYLKYIAPEDIIAYSIDEVMIDLTPYLKTYKLSPRDLVKKMMLDVLETTGVTATAGIGSNLYLAKIAMDIWAKHIPPDKDGVRIARLDEISYRRNLWDHRPLTDFWRVGPGYAKKLEAHGMFTMGDVARRSIQDEDSLYRLFGVNAELLIDHAWGWEPCTIADVKAYKPETNSVGSGQVLQCPYTAEKARLVVHEMADALALDLVGKRLVTSQIVLTVGYDIENLTYPERKKACKGPVTVDRYGRSVPKHAHGTEHLAGYSSSAREIVRAALALFDRVVDGNLLIRRLNLTACNVIPESEVPAAPAVEQLDLFTDYSTLENSGRQKNQRGVNGSGGCRRPSCPSRVSTKKRHPQSTFFGGRRYGKGEEWNDRGAQSMSGKYDDILYLPHYASPTRRRMTMAERAAQFSPFAALAGYEDAVWEIGRVVERRVELSEGEKAVLDQKFQIILAALERGKQPEVTVTYFQPDRKKAGGEYIRYTGFVKRYRETENILAFADETEISLSDIFNLAGKVLQGRFDN